jgi:hypothetical protein
MALAIGGTLGLLQRRLQPYSTFPLPRLFPPQPMRMARPSGIAPIAFESYVRACNRAGIHPLRTSQTIGDFPRSVGYHKRDGVLVVCGRKIEYCAAVDMDVRDLSRARIDGFIKELGRQGFAAWYRHGPKWKNGEHIHAVYALLPMKPQLRGQVNLYLRERREAGLPPLKWETKLRRYKRIWRERAA